jgi:hypothetical protein
MILLYIIPCAFGAVGKYKRRNGMKIWRQSILIIGLIVFTVSTGYSQANNNTNLKTQPEIDRPNTVVFDAWQYSRRYNDLIKMHSSMRKEEIFFNILGYNPSSQAWDMIGTARLKSMTDTDTVNPPGRRILGRYRWFAIQSVDGLDFNISVSISSNDIRITVFDK